MKTECLLDTNAAIEFLNGNSVVHRELQRHQPIILSFITAGELLYGAKNSGRPEANLALYRSFIARFEIIYPNGLTLEAYSDIRLALRKLGKPIPDNDLWQAAIALQRRATLVTDDAHFDWIEGLRRQNWLRRP